jgi:hypothetical protein
MQQSNRRGGVWSMIDNLGAVDAIFSAVAAS